MKNIYNIPIENFNAFKKRIDQLNKKALKLNLEPIKLKILDTFVYDNEVSLDIPCYKIEITQNNQIRVNGYEFAGKLEKNINNTFIYKGKEGVPVSQKEIKICQHCKTNRFRKLLYILQNEKGEYITIGKTCLNDFTGHEDAEKIAQYHQHIEDIFALSEDELLESFLSNTSYTPSTYSIDDVIRASIVSIKDRGYHKSFEGEYSTKDDVYRILHPINKRGEQLFDKAMQLPKQEIEDIKNFILNMESNSDFIRNLKLLITDGFVIDKMLSYAASIPQTVSNEKAKLLKEDLENKLKAESEFIGVIGEKIDVLTTFIKASHYERFSAYTGKPETVNIYTFLDKNNNCIVWKTTASEDFEVGDEIHIKGKVKSHDEYNDIKQTVVTRPTCKFLKGNYKSKYLGTISEELEVQATCTNILIEQVNEGKTYYTYEFLNKKNNCILWKSNTSQSIKVGDKLTLIGTVKAHKTYKGTKQTVLCNINFNML